MRTLRSVLPTFLLVEFLFAAAAPANPIPASAAFVHVQQVQPDFCGTNTITECGQISQFTFDTGELEFDIFLWAPDPRPIHACDLQLSWPASWQFLEGEVCHDGWGWVNPGTGGASLHAEWWPAPVMEDEVFLAARVSLAVDGYGRFSTLGGPGTVTWGDPPETVPIEWQLSATAGVICAYCYHSCPNGGICSPILSADELLFELPPGDKAEQMIEAGVYPPWGPAPSFGATEAWMSLNVVHPGPWPDYWQVFVTADTDGLAPGEYQGWVTATCGCRDCTHVTLRVLPTSSVPSEPTEAPASRPTTWGEIKARFR